MSRRKIGWAAFTMIVVPNQKQQNEEDGQIYYPHLGLINLLSAAVVRWEAACIV